MVSSGWGEAGFVGIDASVGAESNLSGTLAAKYAMFCFGFKIDADDVTNTVVADRILKTARAAVAYNIDFLEANTTIDAKAKEELLIAYDGIQANLSFLDNVDSIVDLGTQVSEIEKRFGSIGARVLLREAIYESERNNEKEAEKGYWPGHVRSSSFQDGVNLALQVLGARTRERVKIITTEAEDDLTSRLFFMNGMDGNVLAGEDLELAIQYRLSKAYSFLTAEVKAILDDWPTASKKWSGIRGDDKEPADVQETLDKHQTNHAENIVAEARKVAKDVLIERATLLARGECIRLLAQPHGVDEKSFTRGIVNWYCDEIASNPQNMQLWCLGETELEEISKGISPAIAWSRMESDINHYLTYSAIFQAYLAAAKNGGYGFGTENACLSPDYIRDELLPFASLLASNEIDRPINEAYFGAIQASVICYAENRVYNRLAAFMLSEGYEFVLQDDGGLGISQAETLQKMANEMLPFSVFARLAIEYVEKYEIDSFPIRQQFLDTANHILTSGFTRMERDGLVISAMPRPEFEGQWNQIFSVDVDPEFKQLAQDTSVAIRDAISSLGIPLIAYGYDDVVIDMMRNHTENSMRSTSDRGEEITLLLQGAGTTARVVMNALMRGKEAVLDF